MTQKFYPYLYQKELKTNTQINTCTFLFLIALFKKNQKMETIQVSISPWVDEQIVVYPTVKYYTAHKGRKKVLTLVARFRDLGSPVLKKPATKGYMLCDSIHVK